MSTSRNIYYFNANISFSGGSQNQGPWNISSLGKILRATARGSLAAGADNIPPTYVAGNAVIFGAQYGPAGYTPLDIVTGADSGQFLWVGQLDLGDLFPVWAPSSDTAQGMYWLSLLQQWNGQLDVAASSDFYLSWGIPFSPGSSVYNVAGTMEIMHT